MSRKSRKVRRTAPVAPNASTPAAEQCEIRGTEVGSLTSSQLELDYSYQRPTEPERVRSIVSQFAPALVNLLKVSARDGHYYVFDGGHTLAALRAINGKKDFPVLCKIYYGLTYEEEAILFAKQQGNAKRVGIPYKLRAMEAAGDQETVDFLERTRRSGFEITPGTRTVRDGSITAVKPAYTKSEETGRVKAIREMSRCGCCGGRIRMSAGREGWTRWNCADCGALGAKATTENIVPQVEAILTSLIRGELAIVEPPHKEPQTSALIQKESNFAAMLEVEDFDESAAMTAAMELAAARYDCIGAEDYETMRIRHRIGQTVGNTNFNIDLLRDIGSEIQIQPSGEVDITLKNGQTTGRNGDP